MMDHHRHLKIEKNRAFIYLFSSHCKKNGEKKETGAVPRELGNAVVAVEQRDLLASPG
jgi:hypothetical protein